MSIREKILLIAISICILYIVLIDLGLWHYVILT